jgi:transcriptional repressor NrdR
VSCGDRFTTYEHAELNMPRIIKSDGSRVPYSEEKLQAGVMRALEKRPVSTEQVEESLARVKHKILSTGEKEVSSSRVGNWIMEELQSLDHVAYIRFASVYLDFGDINAFSEAIDRLNQKKAPKKRLK